MAVVGCGRGEMVIGMAICRPSDVIAGFDDDPVAVGTARRAAARYGVADRVTFEVASAGSFPGGGYDTIVLIHPVPRGRG